MPRFRSAARPQGTSYYSRNIGSWHIVSLDSNIERGKGSAQLEWLKQDLKASTSACTLAYWHHPRFSSGVKHGSDTSVRRFWRVLHRRGADVVLNGHEHNYERFARQTPKQVKSKAGIREFVVGTGGREFYPFGTPELNSQVRTTNEYGVLRLKLRTRSYKWKFKTTAGTTRDRGRSRCS